ncbi:MAG: hypothetical protein LBT30_06615 [Clostridiales bacterium]|nr:hypothetical protein [Clostridiales bacterium]
MQICVSVDNVFKNGRRIDIDDNLSDFFFAELDYRKERKAADGNIIVYFFFKVVCSESAFFSEIYKFREGQRLDIKGDIPIKFVILGSFTRHTPTKLSFKAVLHVYADKVIFNGVILFVEKY